MTNSLPKPGIRFFPDGTTEVIGNSVFARAVDTGAAPLDTRADKLRKDLQDLVGNKGSITDPPPFSHLDIPDEELLWSEDQMTPIDE